MRTILITGAAGLLGSRLADWILVNTKDKVILVDDLSGGFYENIERFFHYKDRVEWVYLDIGRMDYMDGVFERNNVDVVYHFAAYAAEGLSPFIRMFNYRNNTVATASIVNLCIKYEVKRLVFTSSMAVYGNQRAPFDEIMVPSPIDPYGVAKYACEMDIQIAGEQHGLDWCIIRPHNVYGRNQNIWDSYRNVLGIWMWKLMNKHPISIYGDGLQTRAFSAIDDSLKPLYIAGMDPKASKQIINLGGITETSILDAAHMLRDIAGFGHIEHLEPRHEVKHAWATHQKSVDILGFEHKTSLEEGIRDMWHWALWQPKRDRQIWSEYEIDKGLYSYWKRDSLKNPSRGNL